MPASLIDDAKRRYHTNKTSSTKTSTSNGSSSKDNDLNNDKQFHKHSLYWLGLSFAAMIGYALTTIDLSGFIVDDEFDLDENDDDEEEDDEYDF